MGPKKPRKVRLEEQKGGGDNGGYLADPEDFLNQNPHLHNLSHLNASSTNWDHIGCFLEAFTVPGTRKPHMRNMKELPISDFAYQGRLSKYTKEDGIFHDMLDFLYDGDKELIAKSEEFVDKWQDDEEYKWVLQFLDIIDSSPMPKTESREDCEMWRNGMLQKIRGMNMDAENYMTMSSIIENLEKLKQWKDTEDPYKMHDNNTLHSFWRKVLEPLAQHILKPTFSALLVKHQGKSEGVGVINNGLCEYKIDFTKYYEKGESAPAALRSNTKKENERILIRHERLCSNYCVTVKPDLVLQKSICRYSNLRFFTIEIGSQNININKAFLTTYSESSSARSSGDIDDSDEEKMEISSTSKTGDSDSGCSSQLAQVGSKSKVTEHFSPVGSKIRNQHLLELIGAAMYNKDILNDLGLLSKLRNFNILSTAGFLWFHNAIILTRLDADIINLDGKEHKNKKTGKYILCDKILNPWDGHWATLTKYLLACSLGYYFLNYSGQEEADHA